MIQAQINAANPLPSYSLPEREQASPLTEARLAEALDAIVLDGNVRAMEAIGGVLVRAGTDWPAIVAEAVDPKTRRLPLQSTSQSYAMAERVARRALADASKGEADGATNFHRYGERPEWCRTATPIVQIGSFVFYRAS